MVISTINHSWATCEATERYLGFTREHLFSVSVEVTRSTRHAQSSHMFPAVSGLGSPAETYVPPIWGSLVAVIHRHQKKKQNIFIIYWLVVLTILKNISQWEGLSHILWKIKNVPNHQPVNVDRGLIIGGYHLSIKLWRLLRKHAP